jgi:hypothetical protein
MGLHQSERLARWLKGPRGMHNPECALLYRPALRILLSLPRSHFKRPALWELARIWEQYKKIWSKEKQMGTENVKKCAHPNCSCTTHAGKYCSVQCETMEKTPDIACKCGHVVCKGKTD